MIIEQFDKSPMEIGWKYTFPMTKQGTRKKGRCPKETTCFMKIDGQLVGRATIRLHSNTRPNYENARKESMKKMLQTITPGPAYKDYRAKIWSAYFRRKINTKLVPEKELILNT